MQQEAKSKAQRVMGRVFKLLGIEDNTEVKIQEANEKETKQKCDSREEASSQARRRHQKAGKL